MTAATAMLSDSAICVLAGISILRLELLSSDEVAVISPIEFAARSSRGRYIALTIAEDLMRTGEERPFLSTHLDRASAVVIFLTFALFAAALLVKGLTHDLFLETGVLLVSVKLILNTYHMEEHTRRLEARIDNLLSLVRTLAHE